MLFVPGATSIYLGSKVKKVFLKTAQQSHILLKIKDKNTCSNNTKILNISVKVYNICRHINDFTGISSEHLTV